MAYLKFSVKVIPLRMACKRRCGVWMTVDGCGLRMYFRVTVFSLCGCSPEGMMKQITPFLSGRAFDTDKQSLRSVESEALS